MRKCDEFKTSLSNARGRKILNPIMSCRVSMVGWKVGRRGRGIF